MPWINEKEFTRRPFAVITVEAERPASDLRPGEGMIAFEWFNTLAAAEDWATQFGTEFAAADGMGHYDHIPLEGKMRAHLIIVIADTQTRRIARSRVYPEIRATRRWRDETLADLSVLFEPDSYDTS